MNADCIGFLIRVHLCSSAVSFDFHANASASCSPTSGGVGRMRSQSERWNWSVSVSRDAMRASRSKSLRSSLGQLQSRLRCSRTMWFGQSAATALAAVEDAADRFVRLFVREVPGAAHDAVLEEPRARRVELHLGVVIALECEQVEVDEFLKQLARHAAQVGRPAEAAVETVENKTVRAGAVVRQRDRAAGQPVDGMKRRRRTRRRAFRRRRDRSVSSTSVTRERWQKILMS